MFTDCRELPITASNPQAVERFDHTVTSFLAHGQRTADALNLTFQADPDFVLGHVAKGFFFGLLAQSRYDPIIRESLQKAVAAYPEREDNPREKLYIDALSCWYRGQWRQAFDVLERITDRYPLDAFAVKLSHGIAFMLGEKEKMYRATKKILRVWTDDMPDCGYILGCHAFALEELGLYQDAEAVGRKAVDLSPGNTWALHAITHVKEMSQDPREGIRWMTEYEPHWQGSNNLRFHMYWHWALFHLDLEEYTKVVDLYDRYIRQDRTDDYRDMSNAISLLWRLEEEGMDVGSRWEELGQLALAHLDDHKLVFADAHYLMALVRGGYLSQARTFIESLGGSLKEDQGLLGQEVGRPLLEGILAMANNQPSQALEQILPVNHKIQNIGGSHAQRDVFGRLLINAAFQAKKPDLAFSFLEERSRYWYSSHWGDKKKQEIKGQAIV